MDECATLYLVCTMYVCCTQLRFFKSADFLCIWVTCFPQPWNYQCGHEVSSLDYYQKPI